MEKKHMKQTTVNIRKDW